MPKSTRTACVGRQVELETNESDGLHLRDRLPLALERTGTRRTTWRGSLAMVHGTSRLRVRVDGDELEELQLDDLLVPLTI